MGVEDFASCFTFSHPVFVFISMKSFPFGFVMSSHCATFRPSVLATTLVSRCTPTPISAKRVAYVLLGAGRRLHHTVGFGLPNDTKVVGST